MTEPILFNSLDATCPASISESDHLFFVTHRSIFNHIFEKYIESGNYPLTSKVEGHFGKKMVGVIRDLIRSEFITQKYDADGQKLALTFNAFLYCDSLNAKASLKTMHIMFEKLAIIYESALEETDISLQNFVQRVHPTEWKDSLDYLERLLFLLNRSPRPIINLSWSEESTTQTNKTIRIRKDIYPYHDAAEYFRDCYEATSLRIGVLPASNSGEVVASQEIKALTPTTSLPLVFISYATSDYDYAIYIDKVLNERFKNKITTFIAKRDIKSGDDPNRVMLEKNLLNADGVICICSPASKDTGWVWWETSSLWTRGKHVHPLFLNITPADG